VNHTRANDDADPVFNLGGPPKSLHSGGGSFMAAGYLSVGGADVDDHRPASAWRLPVRGKEENRKGNSRRPRHLASVLSRSGEVITGK
jgi:hypothetical protein